MNITNKTNKPTLTMMKSHQNNNLDNQNEQRLNNKENINQIHQDDDDDSENVEFLFKQEVNSNKATTSVKYTNNLKSSTMYNIILISTTLLLCTIQWHQSMIVVDGAIKRDYYYTRTRFDPNHLRISEKFKNKYVNDVKYESKINGTKYEYYKSSMSLSHDELVFETIDKMFKHRLSPFYIHHYDNELDKKQSSDPKLVSQEACARDLMYLIERAPSNDNNQHQNSDYYNKNDNDDDVLSTPETRALFDSYGRQEAGLLMGNTYWVGAYDQCVNRHIFDIPDDEFSYSTNAENEIKSNEQSSATNTNQQKVINFKGRYCVSSLKAPIWNQMIKQRKIDGKNYFKTKEQMDNYGKLFRLQVGVCLPSSCDSNSLERHSEEIKLLTTSQLESRYKNYDLLDLYCLPDETSPLRSVKGSAFYFFLFMAFWATLLFLATLADIFDFVELDNSAENSTKKPSNKGIHRFVSWFSLRANYRKLMKVNPEEGDASSSSNDSAQAIDKPLQHKQQNEEKSDGKDKIKKQEEKKEEIKVNLRFLNAFKVLVMFWIVNGHIMLLMIQTAKNILYSDALLNGFMHFLIGATFGVDLFFTMTGFLTSYLLFNSGHAYKMRLPTWLYLTFHRYWRLAPMYLLTFWFSRSAAQLLGDGPLWDYGTSSITFRGLCNSESWWYPLTLTSNLHGLFEECMITSWYISCDMQFWLFSPLFLHLLAKSPLHGWIASLATIFMSSKVRYDSILSDKSARYDELVQPRADIFMRVSHDLPALYTHPHYRIAAYLVGLLAGHYVYMIKSGKWHSPIASVTVSANVSTSLIQTNHDEIHKDDVMIVGGSKKTGRRRSVMAYTGLALFLIMSFVSYLLSHHFPSSLLEKSKLIAALAYSIDHLIMSVGASLVIVSMCFGQWPSIVKFLSHPNWTRLSKINYALLLLQCEAIYFQIFRYEQIPLAGTRELINILFNLLVTLYPAAFLATLAFEFPLANIEKLLLK